MKCFVVLLCAAFVLLEQIDCQSRLSNETSMGMPPQPPTDSSGKPLPPPTDSSGRPMPPPTDSSGRPMPPPNGPPPQ